VSWLDTKIGRLASAAVGLVILVIDWPNGTINPWAAPMILGAIPRSPLVRGHVILMAVTFIGLYALGAGLWLGNPAHAAAGAVIALLGGTAEIAFFFLTRRRHRLPDRVVATIATQPPQLTPVYNFRLANGEVAYWPVIAGAYLPRRYRRYRLDFRPEDVVDVEPAPREPAW
jgi:hypothetical protein